ncbi:MAG: DUF5063 domain-containing protein [Bacteroidales bacterium]|nr:DUF5063 domain-containing protein [Bacteroidales bacterium]
MSEELKPDTENIPAYSKNVIEMLTVAHEFCLFMEKAESYKKTDLIEYLLKMAPLMYLKGTLLPHIKVDYPESNERFVTEDKWEAIFNQIKEKLGHDDEYLVLSDEGITDNQGIKASIAENISDVYQDMKDFVYLYQKPTLGPKQNAAHEVKRHFINHWGPRLIQAQIPLHKLAFKSQLEEQDNSNNLLSFLD